MDHLDDIDKQLLNAYQRDFPLSSSPFADIAATLGIEEDEVCTRLNVLKEKGFVGRLGGTVRPHAAGASTLAALAVPEARLQEVADIVNAYSEVNHNYEREHVYNMWFVVTASDDAHLESVLADMEQRTGLTVLNLPLVESFHIDLGFPIKWN